MSKGRRKRTKRKIVERRVEVREVLVSKESEKPTKLDIAEFIMNLIGLFSTIYMPNVLNKKMLKNIVGTAWVYPILNGVFGLLLVFLVLKYRKLNQAFVTWGTKKLAGRNAVKTETKLQRVMYLVIYLAGGWIYFFAVTYQYALAVSVNYSDVVCRVLQSVNMAAVVIAGLYWLLAVGLQKMPYTEVYHKRFWVVQCTMLILWGGTGIILFALG